MVDGYELSEDAARRTAAAVRKVEAMTPGSAAAGRHANVPYKPAFYRLATNVGDGKYTCRRQAWKSEFVDEKFIDVGEEHQAEYDRDVTAYDFRGRDAGVAGAAGTGQIVRGWKIYVGGTAINNGAWITLVDVGETFEGGTLAAAREAADGKGAVMRDTQGRVSHGEPIHTAAAWNPKTVAFVTGHFAGSTYCYARYDSRGHLEAICKTDGYWYDWPSDNASADSEWYN